MYGKLWTVVSCIYLALPKLGRNLFSQKSEHWRANGNNLSEYFYSHTKLSDTELEKWSLWVWFIEGMFPKGGS